MSMTDINIPLILWVSFVMIVWFESDIIKTIANLTNTRWLFRMDEYHKYKMEVDVMASYPDFLHAVYDGYLTKLLSCPICLCFWSTLITSNILVYAVGYQQFFALFVFPINYICSLTIYLIVKKLL